MNIIRVNCATYDDFIVERDKILDNFIVMMKAEPSFQEYICVLNFSFTLQHRNTDPNIKGSIASVIQGTFPDDKRTEATKLLWDSVSEPYPTNIEDETTLVMNQDTVCFHIYHSKGSVWIFQKALLNVLISMGFTNTIISKNDIHIIDYKVSGSRITVSGSQCHEWGIITYHWEQSYQDLLTPTEKATKLITGIEDEANKLSIPFNRVDFENNLITEIERLLPITDPIIPQH